LILIAALLVKRYNKLNPEQKKEFESKGGFSAYLDHVKGKGLKQIAREIGVSERTALDYLYALDGMMAVFSFALDSLEKYFIMLSLVYAFTHHSPKASVLRQK